MRAVVLRAADHNGVAVWMYGDTDILEVGQIAVAMLPSATGTSRIINATVANHPNLVGVRGIEGKAVLVGVENGERGPGTISSCRLPQIYFAVVDRIGVSGMNGYVEVVPGLAALSTIEIEGVLMAGGVRVGLLDDQTGPRSECLHLGQGKRDRMRMRGHTGHASGVGFSGRCVQIGVRKRHEVHVIVCRRRRRPGVDIRVQRRRDRTPGVAAVARFRHAGDAAAAGEGGIYGLRAPFALPEGDTRKIHRKCRACDLGPRRPSSVLPRTGPQARPVDTGN